MFILALQRDIMSRLSALCLVVERIPRMVESGEYSALLSELRLHSRHCSDLAELRGQFLALLPSMRLPSLASAEARFLEEIRRAADVAALALVAKMEGLGGITPLPETQVRADADPRAVARAVAPARARANPLHRCSAAPPLS